MFAYFNPLLFRTFNNIEQREMMNKEQLEKWDLREWTVKASFDMHEAYQKFDGFEKAVELASDWITARQKSNMEFPRNDTGTKYDFDVSGLDLLDFLKSKLKTEDEK